MTDQQAERLVTAIEQLSEHMALVAQSNAMLIRAISEPETDEMPGNGNPLGTLDP